MSTVFFPSELHGTVQAPASKSHMQRLLICAALSDTPSVIACGELCGDALTMCSCLNALGAAIAPTDGGLSVEPVKTAPEHPVLYCGESGAALRFLLPLVCALGCGAVIKLGERLAERPLAPLVKELSRCGALIEYTAHDTLRVAGSLRENEFFIPADHSSQYASGLLLACAALGGGTVNITTEVSSAPYIDMTLSVLRSCGVRISREGKRICVSGKPQVSGVYPCEGDWSSAAFWLCAGAVGKQPVTVTGLRRDSVQGDRRVCEILRGFGAELSVTEDAVTAYPSKLRGTDIDVKDVPDLTPALSLVCACAGGVSRIKNAERLRTKESDRIASVCGLISSLGGSAEYKDGAVIIRGAYLKGGRVCTCGDHRIAMAAAVASNVCTEPIFADDFEVYEKSYPGFARELELLGGRYECV